MRLKFANMIIYRHIQGRINCTGFTLFELILVIMLMSGITLAVVYSAQHAIDKMNYERSQVMVQNLKKAIDLYAQELNRYPCPARPGLARTDANYGREDCTWITANRTVASGRDISTYPKKPVEITNADQNRVLIGHLPIYVLDTVGNWTSLGQYVPAIKKEGSNLFLDPTGNPPIYAVAKKLTDREVAAGANQRVSLGDYGNIKIVNENNLQQSGVNNDARYVIVSQTYRNGGCVIGQRDYENCDIVPDVAADNRANDTFMIAPRALNTSSNDYFDDVVLFNNNISDQKWLSNENSTISNNIKNWITENRGLIYLNKNGNNVGISTNTPTEKLDVGGTLRAETNIRAPLICDKPAPIPFPGSTGTVYLYPERYFNPDDIVVTKKNAAGTVSTLVRGGGGDQYTVAAFDVAVGNGTITLNTAPLATDTITIVKKVLCLDPLTVVKRFDASGVFDSNRDSLLCPSGDEISTSGILSGQPPNGDTSWDRLTGCNQPAGYPEGLCAHSGTPGNRRGTIRMQIFAPDPNMNAATGLNYWQLNFGQSSYTKSTGKYGMDRPGQKIILYADGGDTHGAGAALNPANNGLEFEIIGSKARYKYENPVFGDCSGGAAAGPAFDNPLQASARACRGFHTNCSGTASVTNLNACSYNSEMHRILVRPLNGTPVQQTGVNVNFRIQRLGQYLAGTTIDSNGVMRPICKNLEVNPVAVRNGDGTNTCPANQKLRGIQTDGKAICAQD